MLATQKVPDDLSLGLLLLLTQVRTLLSSSSLQLSLTGSLGLRTLGIHVVLEGSLSCSFSLGLVNLLNRSVSVAVEPLTLHKLTCSTNARLCLNVLPLLKW